MFAANNSVSRRYLKRGELIAKRREEAAQNKAKFDCSEDRVARATSSPSLRDKQEGGGVCLPEIAIYNAGYRTVRKDAVHIVK